MQYFNIEDYFGEINEASLSSSDISKAYKVREGINSFDTVVKQVDYITARRTNSKNRKFDYRVFGIPIDGVLDKNRYDRSIIQNQQNKNWSGKKPVKISAATIGRAQAWKSTLIGLIKPAAVVVVLFVLLNMGIYVSGIVGSVGETPFNFCEKGESTSPSINVDGGVKVKDGYKLPIDYKIAGKGYKGQGWSGDDNLRGKGVFASEDFRFGSDDSFSYNNYAIASRWEYVGYSIKDNLWPGQANYGNGISDGVDTSKPYTGLDSAQYSWVVKQKVLVVNPDNGKAVVTMVGNGVDNPNWGGSPLNTVAGLSYKAQEALGFKVGKLDGGDYDVNVRDSGVELEMFWVDENTPVGPTDGGKVSKTKGPSECNKGDLVGGGNTSIADAAVSLAHESIAIATPNTSANHGKGTDLYVAVHDAVLPGDPWYQSCDRFSATAVRWSGADDSYPAGSTGTILSYLQNSDKWKYVPAKSEKDLEPGDIIVKTGHVIVYVGNEAVRKKYPNNSTGVLAHASIGGASSPDQQETDSENRGGAIGDWYDMGLKENGGEFSVFRNVKQESSSKYKNIKF